MPLFCGSSHGALARFFPWDIGLPREGRTSRRPTKPRTATSVRTQFRSFRGVLGLFNPPVLLTTQVAPTAGALSPWAAVVFTSKQDTCRCLHVIWVCLPPESGNWRREDFHLSSYSVCRLLIPPVGSGRASSPPSSVLRASKTPPRPSRRSSVSLDHAVPPPTAETRRSPTFVGNPSESVPRARDSGGS